MITQTCTSHCSACGRHFHGDTAFDYHRQFVDPKSPRWDERECIDPDEDEKMERWTDEGVCRISGEHKAGVVVYRMKMSEAEKLRMKAFFGGANSKPEEPS